MIKRARKTKSVLFLLAFLANGASVGSALAAGPSFDCRKVPKGSIEELICKDEGLSALDHKMAAVYAQATPKAIDEHPPILKAEQRGWIKGRNESFWEHQGEALLVWGYGSPELRCSQRPSSAPTESTAEAANPSPFLADLSVVDMELVDPVGYTAASDLAARGSAPLDIVLKIVGTFDGSSQYIVQLNEGSEAPSASRLTVLRDGLVDDSVRSERWDIALEKWDTLEGLLDNIWFMLERGASHSDDPFHWPVLGTTGREGCRLRTVILRQVKVPGRILVCHTDARAAKVQEIMNCSQTSWLFYHPSKKIQLRISGPTTLHAHDTYADRQWADTKIM